MGDPRLKVPAGAHTTAVATKTGSAAPQSDENSATDGVKLIEPPPDSADRKFPKDGTRGIWIWQPEGDLLGTIIFVHGLWDNVESSVKGQPFAKFNKKMSTPGVGLQEQFASSGVKARFIVPEAEIYDHNSGKEVVWRDLPELLRAADAKGPVAALSHSAGYHTVAYWLNDEELVHVSLIDSMYFDFTKQYLAWLAADAQVAAGAVTRTIDLVGAGKSPYGYFDEMRRKYPKDTWTEKKVPPQLVAKPSGLDPLQAKVLWVDVQGYDHMKLIATGELIPALLKRAEAALQRAAGGVQKPTPKPSAQAAAFVSTSGSAQLDTAGAERIATDLGNFYRFKKATAVTNQTDRPKFLWPRNIMVEYTGPGSDPVAAGHPKPYSSEHRLIHPVLVEPLTTMMTALVEEGERIDDESMKRVTLGSCWRTPDQDGQGFLDQLQMQIRDHPDVYPHPFPRALETEATGVFPRPQRGHRDDAMENFLQHLARQPGWNRNLAEELWRAANNNKAPAGRSTHESGLTVDIDFPYAIQQKKPVAQFHQISTKRNADARLSAAGMWLAQRSGEFHFSSYSTEIEIWHMEWLNWRGTDADDGGA